MAYANNAYADESKTIKEASCRHILRHYFYIFFKGKYLNDGSNALIGSCSYRLRHVASIKIRRAFLTFTLQNMQYFAFCETVVLSDFLGAFIV